MNKLFLTLLTTLCFTVVANAANGECIDGIYYILNEENKTATVTWGGETMFKGTEEYKGNIQIPACVKYNDTEYRVTNIGSYAFYYCNQLISISLPDGLEMIGDYAFYGCSGLSSISLHEGLSRIYNYAFANCNNLQTVSLPKGLETIMSHAFDSCTRLTSISMPEGLTEIMSEAFKSCASLTSLTIPSTVERIGYNACDGTICLDEVFIYSDLLTSVGTGVWSKKIPTYVNANSFKTYKARYFDGYNVKIMPDDDNIGDVIKNDLNFSDEEAEVINKLLSIRSTMGKRQAGSAIEVEGEDGKTLKLYKIKNVKLIKEEE